MTGRHDARYAPPCHESHRQNDDLGIRSRDAGCGCLPTRLQPARTRIVHWQEPTRASPGPESPLWEQLELSRLTKESTRGLATPGPFSFCPEIRDPHIENRIGMASQTSPAWWRSAPARAQASPAGRNPAASGCGGANPPRRTITTLLLRALVVPWRGRLPVEQEVAGSIPVEGAIPQTHQGGLTGRARGPEPRDGGSSPSPGANPPTWPNGKAAVCRTARTRFESSPPEIFDFVGTPRRGRVQLLE